MNTGIVTAPRFASSTRLDVTDVRTDQIPSRANAQRVGGAELYFERRGAKTYLVAAPSDQ